MHDAYKRGLASMVYRFFNKKSAGTNTSGGAIIHTNDLLLKSAIYIKPTVSR